MRLVFLLPLLCVVNVSQAFADDYRCKVVGREWTWFDDIYLATGKYIFVGPAERRFDIFSGWSVFGRKIGKSDTFSGVVDYDLTALGATLQVRQADPGPAFKVCMGSRGISARTIITREY